VKRANACYVHHQEAAWDEIAHDLAQFESQNGFIDSWEMIVGVGIK